LNKLSMPSVGQLVMVRNRPARVTDIHAYTGNGGVTHKIDIRYCDGWFYPETENLIWELEPNNKIQSKLLLPKIDVPSLHPDRPEVYSAYLKALKWTNHSSWLHQDTPELLSPWFAAVQVEDYQLYPVLKSIMMPRVALLLADDVGLGKTIQAGLVLSELLRRRRIRKVLILTPAALQTQWQEEMQEKFHIDFTIIDRAETTRLYKDLGMDTNPWKAKQRIITSMDYLRQPDILDQFLVSAESTLDGDSPSMPWDLLIVDEAHNMAPASYGQPSQRHQMLEQISKYFEHRLFLTATPHNGYTMSFTSLLTLLDPVRFSPKPELDEEDRRHIQNVMVRRLKSELNENTDPPRFPKREVIGTNVDLNSQELKVFEALSVYRDKALEQLNRRSRRERNLGRFLFSLLSKRLLSSTYAFARTWWQHVEGINLDDNVDLQLAEQVQKRAEADIADDIERQNREEDAVRYGAAWMRIFGQEDSLESYQEAVSQSLNTMGWTSDKLKDPITSFTKFPDDGRWSALVAWLEEHLRSGDGFRDDERLILFTEYMDTLNYLLQRFKLIGVDSPLLETLYGGASRDMRDIIKRAFNTAESPLRILLATDAASEGLNFQYHCRYIFHQDIPWNPMRLEQRNGRVDRHNQARDVFIFHYHTDQQAELEFFSRVIKKVNQVREDLGSVGTVFSEATERIIYSKNKLVSDQEIDGRIAHIRKHSQERSDTRTRDSGEVKTYQTALQAFERTREHLEISPETMGELFLQGLKLAGGDAKEISQNIFKILSIPPEYKQLIDDSVLISRGAQQGALPKITFDTAVFETLINGRKIYRNKPDTILLRLNHPLMKRLVGLFERHMWGEDSSKISRWTVVQRVEAKAPVVEISCLYQATNELREILHSDIITFTYDGQTNSIHKQIDSIERDQLSESLINEIRPTIAQFWMDHSGFIQSSLEAEKAKLQTNIISAAQDSLSDALKVEEEAFKNRKKYLREQKGVRALEKLRAKIEDQERRILQQSLFVEDQEASERILRESRWQLEEHEKRIETMLDYVQREEKRTLTQIIPKRFSVVHVDLQPVAVRVIMGVHHD
jgi:superfamily II DNA or RNA helicase